MPTPPPHPDPTSDTPEILSPSRSWIVLKGRGDGLTTTILDGRTGQDLSERYGIIDMTLKFGGGPSENPTLVLEMNCAVVAELTGCWLRREDIGAGAAWNNPDDPFKWPGDDPTV